jgi:hypothetical protein
MMLHSWYVSWAMIVLMRAWQVVETFRLFSPRVDRGEPVPGFLYVVRQKKGAAV